MSTDPTVAGPHPAAPPPPPRRIPGRPCARCGYSLARLPIDGVCPECATPIVDTLKGALHATTPQARARVRRGLLILLVATPLLYVVAPAVYFAGRTIATHVTTTLGPTGAPMATSTFIDYNTSRQATDLARAVALLGVFATVVGHLLLTTPLSTGSHRLTWRRIARLSLLPTLPLVAAFFSTKDPFAAAFAVLALAALWIIHHLAVTLHARTIAHQIPAPAVARHALLVPTIVPPLLVASTLAAMVLTPMSLDFPFPQLPALGFLTALALYWTLLLRLERHLAVFIAERESLAR